MTKEEFIAQVQAATQVYTWHPAIENVGGKRQIAEIYVHGGMLVIRDMLPRAERAEAADAKMREIRHDIAGMEAKLADIRESILA